MEKFKEYLIEQGSTDVENDIKNIKKLTSRHTQGKLLRFIKNLVKKFDVTLVVEAGGGGSRALYKNNKIFIHLDVMNGFTPNSTFNQCYIQLQGVAAHEAAHIIYSDFEAFGNVGRKSIESQVEVPEIAAKYKEATDEKEKEELEKDMFAAIFKYLYYDKLKDLLNALEDGAIESAISRDRPETYGGIVLMRNQMSKNDIKHIEKKFNESEEIIDDINGIMSEMHTLCVYGYREKINLNYLTKYFSKEDIRLIRWYTIYARLGARNTEERLAMSEACLEYLNPLITAKALEYMEKYMSALTMSPDDLLKSMMSPNGGHSEFSVSGQVDDSMSSLPSNPSTSDYSLDLPQDVQQKIQQKLDEKNEQKQKENGSKGQSGQSEQGQFGESGQSSESGESGQSSENQDGSEGNESGEGKDGSEGNESSENKDGTEGNESGEGKDGTEGNESGEGKDGADENGELSEEGGFGSNGKDNASENGKFDSSSEFNNHDIEVEANKAAAAVKESIKKMENERRIIENNNFQKEINGGNGNGKAPSLSSKLSNPDILSDIHKGVTTRLTPPDKIKGESYEGKRAKQYQKDMDKIASTFSKKMKEILMYTAKNRMKTGLRCGKIHQAGLYRAKTDAKVFKKKTEGKICKARICLLMDESGSMCGDKMIDAIKATYILASACAKINVPISILGHNTGGGYCSLKQYVDFPHCKDKSYIEKIFAAQSGSSNHDGLAIFHSLADLARNSNKDELLFMLVISDGAPAGLNGYWGEIAYKDIMATYTKFENEFNIKTIGIGIGDDVESVPLIYKNNIIVPNVESLSDELLKLLKNIILS